MSKVDSELPQGKDKAAQQDDVFADAVDFHDFEGASLVNDINFKEMAENYFARANEIHQQVREAKDYVLDFEYLSFKEDEPVMTPLLESLLQDFAEPLFLGSQTNKL